MSVIQSKIRGPLLSKKMYLKIMPSLGTDEGWIGMEGSCLFCTRNHIIGFAILLDLCLGRLFSKSL